MSYNQIITIKENVKEYINNDKVTVTTVNELAGRNFLNILMLLKNDWDNNITNVAGQIIANDVYKDGIATSFYVNFSIPNEAIVFPLIYYKGYAANSIDSDGKINSLPVEFDLDTGKVKVILNNPDFRGKISVWYEGTTVQNISLKISIFVILGYLVVVIGKTFFANFKKI